MVNYSAWETEPPEISFLKRVCYHESGHAVIQYLLGLKSTGIIIDPVKKYGKCSHDHRPNIGVEIPSWRIPEVEREVLHLAGGTAAEWVLTGVKECDRQSADYRYSVEMLTPICENEEEIDAYVALLLVRAKNLLSKTENWKAVVELADALIVRTDNDSAQDRSVEEDLPPEHPETGRGFREMTGEDVEATIRYAFNKDANTYDN